MDHHRTLIVTVILSVVWPLYQSHEDPRYHGCRRFDPDLGYPDVVLSGDPDHNECIKSCADTSLSKPFTAVKGTSCYCLMDLSAAQGVSSEALCHIPCGEETCGGLGAVYSVYNTECEVGYYGSSCLLQCHCADNVKCTHSGQCPGGQCEKGWESSVPGGRLCDKRCDDGFFGFGCSRQCHCKDSAPCNKRTGLCPLNSPLCDPEFVGKKCDLVSPCVENPCKNDAECHAIEGDPWTHECECTTGWTGDLCQEDINECDEDTDDCNQECENIPGSYNCTCNSGFALDPSDNTICEDINECASENYCDVENGECKNIPGSYHCTCNHGYELQSDGFTCKECPYYYWGENCANRCHCSDGDDCDMVDGHCSGQCESGWEGYSCNIPRMCTYSGCMNGGVCVSEESGDRCECAKGVTGLRCEIDVDECELYSNGCKDLHGTCVNTMGSWSCVCDVGHDTNRECKEEAVERTKCLPSGELYSLGDVRYAFIPTQVGIDNARLMCGAEYGMEVLWYENERESDWLMEKLTEIIGIHADDYYIWLGLNWAGASYIYLSGHPVTFTNWGPGEPYYSQSYIVAHQRITVHKTIGTWYTADVNTGKALVVCKVYLETLCPGAKIVDDCLEDNSGCEQKCEYSVLGSVCDCYPGYQLQDDDHGCTDLDECAYEGEGHTCSDICINTPGSYQCGCPDEKNPNGDGHTCRDINPCDTANGGCNQICSFLYDDKYKCECWPGWQLAANLFTCMDIDECGANDKSVEHECSHICINTEGSYKCDCPDGYELAGNGRRCNDIDECQDNNGWCDQICQDQEGIYYCDCYDGFRLGPDNHGCEDVNECYEYNDCSHECINTHGTYRCACPDGYYLTFDQRTCADIRECEEHNGRCDQICHNKEGIVDGGYECDCYNGFILGRDGHSCLDVDECILFPCDQLCVNTQGSFLCDCEDGYQLSGRNNCTDVDECDDLNGGCHHICENTEGSFACSCLDGYKLADNSMTCDVEEKEDTGDKDPCSIYEEMGYCKGNSHCIMDDGRPRCSCIHGWEGHECLTKVQDNEDDGDAETHDDDDDDDDEETDVLLLAVFTGLSLLCVVMLTFAILMRYWKKIMCTCPDEKAVAPRKIYLRNATPHPHVQRCIKPAPSGRTYIIPSLNSSRCSSRSYVLRKSIV